MAASRLRGLCGAVLFAGLLALPAGPGHAQSLFGPLFRPAEPAAPAVTPQMQPDPATADDPAPGDDQLPPELRRQVVSYPSNEPAGTIIIDTAHTFLYLTLGNGSAMRYGIGVGRQGFTWSGVEAITRKAEWPDWFPPPEMVARQPYLPRFVAGGPGNPLGARALYLGNTDYRIHGTNDPTTIGKRVSSGCIRLENADVIDLYGRVGVGTRVIVLPNAQRSAALDESRNASAAVAVPSYRAARPAAGQPEAIAASTSRSSVTGIY